VERQSVSKCALQKFGKGRFNLINPNIVEVTENSEELKSQTGLQHLKTCMITCSVGDGSALEAYFIFSQHLSR